MIQRMVWIPLVCLKSEKLGGSDLKQSNPYGDQVAHFVGYTKSPNAQNSCCNCKIKRTMSYARPIICVSSTNEGKTQVRWDVVIGRRTQK